MSLDAGAGVNACTGRVGGCGYGVLPRGASGREKFTAEGALAWSDSSSLG